MYRIFAAVVLAVAVMTSAAAAPLKVAPRQIAALGIRTAPVKPAAVQTTASILGRVVPALNARLQVAAPFAGTVKWFLRMEGETVKAGEPLAVIASRDMREARARLVSLQAQYRTTKAGADRARQLVVEGIAPRSRLEEAKARLAAAAANLAAIRSSTERAGRVEGNPGEYRLLAPADGRIAAIAVGLGQQVAEMQPVLTIDGGGELWIEGDLPAVMVGQVSPGDRVMLEGRGVEGEVVAAAATINPKTRSAMLRARMPHSASLVSGQTLRISVLRKTDAGTLEVPRTAVVHIGDKTVVYAVRKGGFEPVPVTVVAYGAKEVTVRGRLNTADRVAVSGVSELKALTGRD